MGLSTSHDRPGYEIIVHHLWEFIANDDRANLVQSDNIFSEYAQLRLSAYQNRHAILQLQHRRPSLDDIPPPPYAANLLEHVERTLPFSLGMSVTAALFFLLATSSRFA